MKNKIIMGLECCVKSKSEQDCMALACPYYLEENCTKKNGEDILKFINYLLTENERLKTEFIEINSIKKETIEKFWSNWHRELNNAKEQMIEIPLFSQTAFNIAEAVTNAVASKMIGECK